jgi:uncharacterized repeat protein (TIGR03803 family)
MKKFISLLFAWTVLGMGISSAQITDVYNFSGGNGNAPLGNLTVSGNVLYGMTEYGGDSDLGRIFSIYSNGTGYKDLLDFDSINGANPFGTLTLSGNVLYGMTFYGGIHNLGCIFSIDTNGDYYRDLLDFNDTNGQWPRGSLLVSGNILFGMTSAGGADGSGCLFSVDTNGNHYKDLLDFNTSNGANPFGSVIMSAGKLYGMTSQGGKENDGCIFSIDTDGTGYTDLHNFNDTAGQMPYGDLLFSGGILFGMTSLGGADANGCVFSIDTNGSNYRDLLDFNEFINGAYPHGSLIFYENVLCGMTSQGGNTTYNGCIFSVDTNGSGNTVLVNFADSNGATPYGSLALSGGVLYGMTWAGGTGSDGIVFGFQDTVTGINKVTSSSATINIYPNPNNGAFTVQSSVVSNQLSVEVYNVLGEKIYSRFNIQNPTFKIDVSSNPSGVYLYRIMDASGALLEDGKFVITH